MMSRLFRERAGSVGVMFGLLVVPIMLAAGFAVDFTRLSVARAGVQGIVDRAAVAAATLNQSTAVADDAAAKLAANNFLAAANLSKYSATLTAVNVTLPNPDTIRVKVSGKIDTTFMALGGTPSVEFEILADAIRGMNGTLELVLALDTTASMAGTKMTTLKSAAGSLIDNLQSQIDGGANIKLGLVPFANYVNVGLSQAGQPWLSVPSSTYACGDTASPLCVTTTSTCYNDTNVAFSCNRTTCPNTATCTANWNGCVGSRAAPFNANVDQFPVRKISGLRPLACGSSIIALTANTNTVKSTVNALVSSGNTYIPSGLIWGFNLLTPGGPMSLAAPWDATNQNKKPRKALVLMTDGENSKGKNPSDAWHEQSGPAARVSADTLTKDICNNIKAKKIEIFTIAFSVTDIPTKTMLENCATGPGYFYDASSSAALLAAFQKIGSDLQTMRIAR